VIIHNRLFAECEVLNNYRGLCGPRTRTDKDNLVESDRSHDESQYGLPDNYVALKPITDDDNRCLKFVNTDAQRPLVLSPLGPRLLRRSKGAADVSFRGGGDVSGAL